MMVEVSANGVDFISDNLQSKHIHSRVIVSVIAPQVSPTVAVSSADFFDSGMLLCHSGSAAAVFTAFVWPMLLSCVVPPLADTA